MERRLFEDLVVCRAGGAPSQARLMPVSMALHAVVLASFVLVPLLTSSELPEPPAPLGPLTMPAVILGPSGGGAPKPVPAQPAPAAPAPKPRALVAPSREPDAVPAPENDSLGPPDPAGVSGVGDTVCLGADCVPGGGGLIGGTGPGIGPAGPPIAPMPPVRVGGEIRPPLKIHDVAPVYPELARRVGVTGIVILECTLDATGHVSNLRVLRGHPLLDAAAVEAVQQWIYKPTRLNGIAVPVIMTVTVNFSMPGR